MADVVVGKVCNAKTLRGFELLFEKGDLVGEVAQKDIPGSVGCPLVSALDIAPGPVVRSDLPKEGGRVLLVGDVHGCFDELQTLLQQQNVNEDCDTVLLLGDLVNKGPKSIAVLQWAMANTHFVLAIRGNHEDGALHAKAILDNGGPLGDSSFAEWVGDMTAEEVRYLRSLPLILALPRFDVICVHAGLLAGVPLAEQPHVVCTKLRVLVPLHAENDESDAGQDAVTRWAPFESNYKLPTSDKIPHDVWIPWHTLWGEGAACDIVDGAPAAGSSRAGCAWQASHVVFGHDAVKRLQLGKWATGLDTACYSGNPGSRLSAMVLGPGLPSESYIARRRLQGYLPIETDRPGLIISTPSLQPPLHEQQAAKAAKRNHSAAS